MNRSSVRFRPLAPDYAFVPMPHTLFNSKEVADYLHVTVESIEILVKRREIPCERQGERFIFRRRDIDVWASQRILGFKDDTLTEYHRGSSAKVDDLSEQHAILPELMQADYIDLGLTSKTKPSIVRDMAGLANQTGLLIDEEGLLGSLIEREEMRSTALAGGLALLHPRHHDPYMSDDSFIVLGRTIQPVPFGAPDDKTTDLFFLICCQDDRIHLHVLARICMMCNKTDLLMEIREADESAMAMEVLLKAEEEVIRSL